MLWGLLFLAVLPTASAIPNEAAFPNISFRTFNVFVQENFGTDISLATVLMVLFTLTNNPTLLSLHARQQNPAVPGENKVEITAWIKALARALQEKLADQIYTLQKDDDTVTTNNALINSVGGKLDQFAKHLNLYPYNSRGKFQGKLKTISHAQIQPVFVICPDSIECEEISCEPWAVHQITKTRDIPKVTLVKGSDIYQNVSVLTGQCFKCKTLYSADHETLSEVVSEGETRNRRIYLNSAKYLKVGQSVWVDRVFSNAVVNGMYSFHASASAYMEYWNNSFGVHNQDKPFELSRRQIWQTFVQESTRTIAASAKVNLELNDGLAIDEVTKEAFNILGESGLIRAADQHSCTQCTQKYKATSDIDVGADPAAVAGVDKNQAVPPMLHPNSESSTSNLVPRENMQNELTENESAEVKLVVMDGIVMGPQHCAFDNCTADLMNFRGGAFCSVHEIQYGAKCRVRGCLSPKVNGTQACHQHKEEWSKYEFNHKPAIHSGMR